MKSVSGKDVSALFSSPSLNSFFSVLAGLGFMLICMLLPLVAKAGSAVEHSRENRLFFTAIALLTLLLACSSVAINLLRRKRVGAPLRPFSLFVAGIVLTLLAALQLGWLSI